MDEERADDTADPAVDESFERSSDDLPGTGDEPDVDEPAVDDPDGSSGGHGDGSSGVEGTGSSGTSAGESPDEGYQRYDPEADHVFPDERLNRVLTYLDADTEVRSYLQAQNVNPVDRMEYNDHGSKHIEIVRNRALCLYDLLKEAGVEFNGAADQGLDEADEAVIVALAATLHDIGHVVHRDGHAYYSIPLAAGLLDRLLPEFYDPADAVRVKGEVLHAILCHHTEETPLTTEAGVIRVADALDMERGRSRIPYEKGGRGINTLSSRAIRRVSLKPGEAYPVLVEIEMTSAVGVYQVDSLLKAKLTGSGLEDEIRIVAVNTKDDDSELVERIEL